MKPVATPLPMDRPPTNSPVRGVVSKVDTEEQSFSNLLGQKTDDQGLPNLLGQKSDDQGLSNFIAQNENLPNGQPVNDHVPTETAVQDEEIFEMITNARQRDDQVSPDFPPLITAEDAAVSRNVTDALVEVDQTISQEVKGDQFSIHKSDDLAERAYSLVSVSKQASYVETLVKNSNTSELGSDQLDRIKSQLNTTAQNPSGLVPNKLDVPGRRESLQSITQHESLAAGKAPPPSTSVASDQSKAIFANVQRSLKSGSTSSVPVASSIFTSSILSDKQSNIRSVNPVTTAAENPNGGTPSQVIQANPTLPKQAEPSSVVQIVLQDEIDVKEIGASILSSNASVEVSNSSLSSTVTLPGEKPVWSQVVEVLSSNLTAEAREKSTTSAVPIFTPASKNAVIIKSLNLELQPGDLGTVKIELSLKNQKLTVELIAETADAADRLKTSQEMIYQKMKSDGYLIDQFVIKNVEVGRGQEANRLSESFVAAENNESEKFGSNENGASSFDESEKRRAGEQNITANERTPEADGRRDDEIYL